MSDVLRRLLILLGAVAIGGLFGAGLFVHGRVGGVLLLITDAILLGLTRTVWAQVRPQGRPLRIVIIVVIAVIAVAKLAMG